MPLQSPSAWAIATYSTLLLSVLSLWGHPVAWIVLSGVSVVLGYLSGTLFGPAILWIALLAVLCWLYAHFKETRGISHRQIAKFASAVGIGILAILLGTHSLPGFRNLLVAQNVMLSAGATPYTLYLNFDKTMVGILVLGFIYRSLKISLREWVDAFRRTAPILVLIVTVLIASSLALGYLHFDPKWHGLFWIWALSNLLMTCLSEEAFFRGFLQRELATMLNGWRHAARTAVVISAITFGFVHIAGGWTYVLLATLAGLGYALVYARTGRIEMAMLTHFVLNATHFLLFTYPRSALQ